MGAPPGSESSRRDAGPLAMPAASISQFRSHLGGVRAGDRFIDRAAIFVLVALRGLAPVWRLFHLAHLRVPSPLVLVRRYRIRDGAFAGRSRAMKERRICSPIRALGAPTA